MKFALPAYAALAFAFLHLPLLVLAAFSVNSSRFAQWEGVSLRWYRATFADGNLMEAAGNSLVVALISTLVATVVGTLAAYGLHKRRTPWLSGSLYLSLVSPEIVTGVATLAFFQWTFRYFGAHLGLHTVMLAHVAFSISYVVVVVLARLRALDPSLEEAALDLGATEWRTFARVVLPQLAPGIAAAALLAFTISFDDYVITSLVAGVDSETLPMVMYSTARRGASPALNAISTVVVVALGALILISERLRAA